MMKRFKFLALAAALAIPLAACDEGSQSTVVIEGSVVGVVSIEGVGQTGVTVTLSSGGSTTTDASGAYSFSGVKAGSYTVSITFQAGDVTFPSTSKGVVIQSAGETVTANFDGQYVRTSAISGVVSAGGAGLAGVQVTLGGTESGSATTDASGGYSFTGLRMGAYTVTISGFDANKYSFNSTSQSATLGSGASAALNFAGSENATGVVNATVTIDGAARSGVTLTLSTGDTEVTNSAGRASFSGLAKGTYGVTVTNPDSKNIDFENLSQNATIAEIGGSADVTFVGTTIADAGISGTISNTDDGPYADFAVSLSNGDETTTDADGMYAFTGLESGSYTVTITNPDPANLIFDRTSVTVNVSNPNSVYVENFTSMYRADNSVAGRVWFDITADGEFTSADEPAAGFEMTATSAALGMSIEAETDVDGKYIFDGLRSGSWVISCVSCPAEMGGRIWTWTADTTVELAEGSDLTANFLGVTAGYTNDMVGNLGIQTADASESGAWAFAGVDITVVGPMIPGAGDPPTATTTTDADGLFSFEGLAPGNYNVTIDVTDLPAGISLAGPATVTVNVADDLAATATVPPFLAQIDAYTINVPVHYGPEGSTAFNDGDQLALYQSEQLDALVGNLLDVVVTDDGYATYLVPAANVIDDYVLYTCLPSAVAACTDGVIQMGAAILRDPVLEHRVLALVPEQTVTLDHNLVMRSFSLEGLFRQPMGEPVPDAVVTRPRVLLRAALGWNTVDNNATATFGTIPDDIPGDGLDQNGAPDLDEDEGEFTFNTVNAIADLGLNVNQIAGGVYIYVTGNDCDLVINGPIAGCSVGSIDHLLDYVGNDDEFEVFFFDGSSRTAVPVEDAIIEVSYPNPDIRFRAWHETNDIRGYQSGVGGDDTLENADLQLHIGWDWAGDGTFDYAPAGDCLQSGADPSVYTCFTDATGALGDVDMIDQSLVTILALSNDAPNVGPPLSPISELQFIDASVAYEGMVTIDADDPNYPAPLVFDGESQSEIDITTFFNDSYFIFDLEGDGHGYKFRGNTARGLLWDEFGSILDDNGIRNDDAAERAVGGVIFEISAADGQLGFEGFTPFSATTTPNINSFPPNGNAGVARFDDLLEGTYNLNITGTDVTIFTGSNGTNSLVVVDRSTGDILFETPEEFSDEVDVVTTVADVKASPANAYEVQYTNGLFSGFVFENEDDNSVIDPSEGQADRDVLLERIDENTGLFAPYMTVTSGVEGFWSQNMVQEGSYRTSLPANAGIDLEGSNPASRPFDVVDLGRFGSTSTYTGGGVNLLGMPGAAGDAFDGLFAAIPDPLETDLEMVHNNGIIRVRAENDATGALLGGLLIELRMCDIDPANVEDDVNAPGGGVCPGVPVAADEDATSTTTGPVTFTNLIEGFYEVTIGGGAPVTGTNTWYVRIDRSGEIAERTTTY